MRKLSQKTHSRFFMHKYLLTSARSQEKGNIKEDKNHQERQAHQLLISQIQAEQYPHRCAVRAFLSLFIKKQHLPTAKLAVLNTAIIYLSWLLYLINIFSRSDSLLIFLTLVGSFLFFFFNLHCNFKTCKEL